MGNTNETAQQMTLRIQTHPATKKERVGSEMRYTLGAEMVVFDTANRTFTVTHRDGTVESYKA